MKKISKIMLAVISVLIAVALTGCSELTAMLQELKGELIGNNYVVYEYDNYGNLTFQAHGRKIAMSCELDEAGEVSSYIDITIDGESWKHVGSTLVFVQKGVDMITDFSVPEEMESGSGSTGLISIDRFINDFTNKIGKDQVVLVSSQNGVPVAMFQGDDCYFTIPDDLPKTTLVSIDDKLVYVHRANVDIIPKSLFK